MKTIKSESDKYSDLIIGQYGGKKKTMLRNMLRIYADKIKNEEKKIVDNLLIDICKQSKPVELNQINNNKKKKVKLNNRNKVYWPPEIVFEKNMIHYEKSMLFLRNIKQNFTNKWIPTRCIEPEHFNEIWNLLESGNFGEWELDEMRNCEFFRLLPEKQDINT